MPTNFEKLRGLLEELFQLDQADLDFGIYRIMNQRRDEIVRFLDKDLLPQVKQAFSQYKSADKTVLQADLDKLKANIVNAGMKPDDSPKVKDLERQITDSAADVTALENEVFSHLFNFFRRYYSEGDFISQRRYKEGVYAIPYEGEEVKLYWANADQYYIKSSEAFGEYTFALESGRRVRFHVVAATTAQDDTKFDSGKEPRFFLRPEAALTEDHDELHVHFEFRRRDTKEAQDELNRRAVLAIVGTPGFGAWTQELSNLAPTGGRPERTVLEKHLEKYTTANTFDYFIHKDLGRFLRRELDFYIKNEVMHLDDLEQGSAPRAEQYLSQVTIIRAIGQKIIQFLEQLENFQKRLWLKRKFVIGTHYCITLDRVPETLYAAIAANVRQIEEWIRLFSIDRIGGDLHSPAFSVPLTADFLKAHRELVLDTRHFETDFVDRLVCSVTDLDASLDGIAIRSDNFQAMRLAYARFRDSVRAVYIDPPYNTGDGDFPYKDSYQHSSWLAMMDARIALSRALLAKDGSFICHIDEHEYTSLDRLLSLHFGDQENIGPIIWDKRNPKGDATGIATQHEYIAWAAKCFAELKTPQGALYRQKENSRAILTKAAELARTYGGPSENMKAEFKTWIRGQEFSGGEKAYSEIDDNGDVYRPVSMAWPNKQRAPEEYFKPLIHPVTREPCPVPARGWRNPPQTMNGLLTEGLILFGRDHTTQPTRKYLLKDNMTENVPSVLYFGGSDDDLQADMGYSFPNPKPLRVAQYITSIAANRDGDFVVDCFAGSGTVGHAIIASRRSADHAKRRFLLIDMGQYFTSVMLLRLKKAIYSGVWKNGAPQGHVGGVSFMFKYFELESYEDTLNNLRLNPAKEQAALIGADAHVREQYLLSYMLEVETRESQSLLNVKAFCNPSDYHLRIERDGESRLVKVDLVETFNWLLGLTVKHIDVIRGVRVVEATNPNDERVLVLWRDTDATDNDALDAWFKKQDYNTKELVYDLIYVNGDNNLENLRRADQTWKVRLIEEEFHRLMFAL